jgi:hypothetical protein
MTDRHSALWRAGGNLLIALFRGPHCAALSRCLLAAIPPESPAYPSIADPYQVDEIAGLRFEGSEL